MYEYDSQVILLEVILERGVSTFVYCPRPSRSQINTKFEISARNSGSSGCLDLNDNSQKLHRNLPCLQKMECKRMFVLTCIRTAHLWKSTLSMRRQFFFTSFFLRTSLKTKDRLVRYGFRVGKFCYQLWLENLASTFIYLFARFIWNQRQRKENLADSISSGKALVYETKILQIQ